LGIIQVGQVSVSVFGHSTGLSDPAYLRQF
jgi:hypothetical protein